MGEDVAKDALVFGDGLDKTWFPFAVASEDGTHVAFVTEKGWSATDVVLEERATGKRTPIVSGGDGEISYVVRVAGGSVWVRTNLEAPRYRLAVARPGAEGAPTLLVDVARQREWTLDGVERARGAWLLRYLDAAASRVVVLPDEGTERDLELPEPLVELSGLAADESGPRFAYSYSSFATPSALVESDAETGASRPLVRVDAGVKAGAFRVERVRYPSADGTLVPMRVVRPGGEAPRGPTLLTGYGGFNVSLGPGFDTRGLVWVERGGTFAEPNLRGGGEFGEPWHRAGSRENKFRVFEDFEHAMRWLIDQGIATPSSLAISGGSNGGLLVGAMTVRCPELFAAAAGDVGLYDMMRYHLWPPADIWSDEYGSAKDPAQAGYLLGYSPYHQVRPGVRYPAFLGRTAEQDERVSWRHTAKFVAALEAARAPSPAPVLFHMETKVGHGQGKPRSERVRDASRLLRFLRANAEAPR
jgi:prolyl oligopeptidase